MLDKLKAKSLVAKKFPSLLIKDCFKYNDIYLVRIEHEDSDEGGYDPFLSVDLKTNIIQEFSVLTDGDPIEIAEAFEKRR
jgi:hypothetical protein